MPNCFRFHPLLALLLALLLSACTGPAPRTPLPSLPDPVLLVSIDSLHPEQVRPDTMPVLHALAEAGVRAAWMRPSYPTLTFPNHYTVVTGLRPDRHGIVDNTMWDSALGSFVTRDRRAVENPAWWGGEPIWNTAGRQGLRTASMFWVGSEAPVGGRQPDEWHRFSYEVSIAQRIKTVLGWFARPEAEWPRLSTLYFEHADVAGHDFGPDSPEQLAALAEIDRALGELLDGFARQGMRERIRILVTSDHGMAQTSAQRVVLLDDLIDLATVRLITFGEVAGIEPLPEQRAAVEAALIGRHEGLECWRREDLPPAWDYGRHPRIAAIVCQADLGWKVLPRQLFQRWSGQIRPGSHGYAPQHPEMRATFIAQGPGIAEGRVIGPVDNVDVYPLMAALLGIQPAPNDGDLERIRAALR